MKGIVHVDRSRMQKKELVWIYPTETVNVVIDQSYSGVKIIIRNIDPETMKIIGEDEELSEFIQISDYLNEIYIKQDVTIYVTVKEDLISISYENDIKSFSVTIVNPIK